MVDSLYIATEIELYFSEETIDIFSNDLCCGILVEDALISVNFNRNRIINYPSKMVKWRQCVIYTQDLYNTYIHINIYIQNER